MKALKATNCCEELVAPLPAASTPNTLGFSLREPSLPWFDGCGVGRGGDGDGVEGNEVLRACCRDLLVIRFNSGCGLSLDWFAGCGLGSGGAAD